MVEPHSRLSDYSKFPDRTNNPGEPLYTLEELARMGRLDLAALRALVVKNQLRPWLPRSYPKASASYPKYRKSDFRVWWQSLPEASKAKARLTA